MKRTVRKVIHEHAEGPVNFGCSLLHLGWTRIFLEKRGEKRKRRQGLESILKGNLNLGRKEKGGNTECLSFKKLCPRHKKKTNWLPFQGCDRESVPVVREKIHLHLLTGKKVL